MFNALMGVVSSTRVGFLGETDGDVFNFESGVVKTVCITRLTDTTAVIGYGDVGDSTKGKAVVVTTLDGTPSPQTPFEFDSVVLSVSTSIDRLSDTAAVIVYNIASGGEGWFSVLEVLDGTETSSTPVEFGSTDVASPYVASLTGTTAVVCFVDPSDTEKGKVVVLTDLLGTPGAGSIVEFEADQLGTCSVARLTSTTAIACFYNATDTEAQITILSSLGGTPSPANNTTLGAADNAVRPVVIGLTSTTAVAFFNNSATGETTGAYLTVLAGTPVVGTLFDAGAGIAVRDLAISKITNNSVLLAYRDEANSQRGTAIEITKLNTTPVPGTPFVFETGNTGLVPAAQNGIGVAMLTETRALTAYLDFSAASIGNARKLK